MPLNVNLKNREIMISEKELRAAAQEFIDVMLLTTGVAPNKVPLILNKTMKRTDFEKIITEAIPWIEAGDEFTKETIAIIETLKGEKQEDSNETTNEVEETPKETNEPTLPTLEQEVGAAEKLKDLKAIALTEPLFKSIRGKLASFKTADDLREEMLWIMSGSKVPSKPATEQELPMEEDKQEMAEKLHEKLVGKKEVNETKTSKKAPIVIKKEEGLPLGNGMMSTGDLVTIKPFNNLFDIDPKVLESIKTNMEVKGFDPAFPILVWEDVVIDGHTRLEAAETIGIQIVPIIRKAFANEQEALEYAIHNQRDRRNLSQAELLRCIAVIDAPMSKEEASALGGSSDFKTKNTKKEPSHVKTAKTLGVGQSKVTDARVVLSDEQATKDVESGKKSISAAAKEVREKKNGTKPKKETTKPKEKTLIDMLQEALFGEIMYDEDAFLEMTIDCPNNAWKEVLEVVEDFYKK